MNRSLVLLTHHVEMALQESHRRSLASRPRRFPDHEIAGIILHGFENIDHIVVGIPVNQLVVRVDAGQRRLLVDDDLKGPVPLGELFLLQIERLFLVLGSPLKTPTSM
jgi:hypothetical protein